MTSLVEDIYSVVTKGADVPLEASERFGKQVSDIITQRLTDKQKERQFTLRMSNIGKGARALYYDKYYGQGEEFSAPTLLKFMLGDLTEALLLFLAELSGHEVTHQQHEVNLDGIVGHIDAIIDGVVVDVKSASSYSFKKFKDGSLLENDSFGYAEQLGGYATALDKPAAWMAMDKQSGHVTYLPLEDETIKSLNLTQRIEYVKAAVDSVEEPERCYSDIEEGKSGNRSLDIVCNYCSHKYRCWADANNGLGLRIFNYSSGPKFLTKVVVEPKVNELFSVREEI